MAEPKFKIAFAIDAQEFLKSIPDSAREKSIIIYVAYYMAK